MDKELIIVLVFGVILFLMMLSSLVMFVLYYQKRRQHHVAEIKIMESQFEQETLKAGMAIQEQTFATIASEIHDNIGQLLSLAKMRLGVMANGNPYQKEINEVSDLLSLSLGDLRDLSKSLHPSRIAKQSLYESIAHEMKHYQKLGYALVAPKEPVDDDLPEAQRVIIFRVVQEALNNIVKHAKASQIEWDMRYDSRFLTIDISDNGVGLPSDLVQGIGSITTDERMKLLGGTFERFSKQKSGTRIQLRLPVLNEQ